MGMMFATEIIRGNIHINRVRRVNLTSWSWLAAEGKSIFPCPRSRLKIWLREMGSALPPPVGLSFLMLRLNLLLTHGIPPVFQDGVHILLYNTVYRHGVSPKFIMSRNYVPMAFTAESPVAGR